MVSPAEEVARLFYRVPGEDPEDESPLRTVTVRLPESRLVWIDAMAEEADLSRNAMLVNLLRVGVSSVMGSLPDEVREIIEENINFKLQGDR
jgi:hypothetical protein